MKKKWCALFIVVALTFSTANNTVQAAVTKEYQNSLINQDKVKSYEGQLLVALGDSIGTGYLLENAENESYVNKLSKALSMQKENYAVNGRTSDELLDSLLEGKDNEKIKEASVITVSIGGNDIMLPLIGMVESFLPEGKSIDTASFDELSNAGERLISGEKDSEIKSQLSARVKIFNEKFPRIIDEIKKINPKAQIVVQTIYNPFNNALFLDHPYELLNPYLLEINNQILGLKDKENYMVADIYKDTEEISAFQIVNLENYDIHPNKKGHNIMFLANYKLLTDSYPYNISSELNNISVDINYSEDTISPKITLTAKEGYALPGKITVVHDDGSSQNIWLDSDSKKNVLITISSEKLYSDIILKGDAEKIETSGDSKEVLNPTSTVNDNNNNKEDGNNIKAYNNYIKGENTSKVSKEQGTDEKSASYKTGDSRVKLLISTISIALLGIVLKSRRKIMK